MKTDPASPRALLPPGAPRQDLGRLALVYLAVGLAWALVWGAVVRPRLSGPWSPLAGDALFFVVTAGLFLAALQRYSLRGRGDWERVSVPSAALTAAANAVFIADREGRIVWMNEAYCRMSGYQRDELIGSNPRLLQSGGQDPEYYEKLWGTILAGQVWSGEMVERRKDGECYVVQQTVTPVRDPDGQARHFIAIHEDVTARKRAEERAAYQAYHDALTELPNRKQFQDRLP